MNKHTYYENPSYNDTELLGQPESSQLSMPAFQHNVAPVRLTYRQMQKKHRLAARALLGGKCFFVVVWNKY